MLDMASVCTQKANNVPAGLHEVLNPEQKVLNRARTSKWHVKIKRMDAERKLKNQIMREDTINQVTSTCNHYCPRYNEPDKRIHR